MKIYDLSQTISDGMKVYPGDPEFSRRSVSSTPEAIYNTSLLSIGSHCGTHIDAPLHFLHGGTDAAGIPLDSVVGRAVVLDMPCGDGILRMSEVPKALSKLPPAEILVLRTGWERFVGQETYFHGFPAFDTLPCDELLRLGIRAVAVDMPSVSVMGNQREAHQSLLSKGIIIIEGLVGLSVLPQDGGELYLSAVPLKLSGSDGSPARVYAFSLRD